MGKKKYTFDIGNNRLLTIAKKYDQLCVEEKDSVKSALLLRLAGPCFLFCLDDINSQLEKFVAGENVAYRCHYYRKKLNSLKHLVRTTVAESHN